MSQQYPQQPAVSAKNPGLALVASFFIPGLGSMINGRAVPGIAIFVAYVTSWFLMLVVIGFVTAPAVWIVGMWHGYSSAQEWNAKHGVIS